MENKESAQELLEEESNNNELDLGLPEMNFDLGLTDL